LLLSGAAGDMAFRASAGALLCSGVDFGEFQMVDRARSLSLCSKRNMDLSDYTYKGAYAKLMGFLEECRLLGCEPLSQEKYKQLTQAVENLTQSGTTAANMKEHFKGHEREKSGVLYSLGITFEDDMMTASMPLIGDVSQPIIEEDMAPRTSKKRMTTAANRAGDHLTQVADEIVRELTAQRHPEDYESDVLMLTHAFTHPMGLLCRYSMKAEKLGGWLLATAQQYFAVPYHNWQHAMDVFFFAYYCVTQGQAGKFLNFQDILAMFVAAIAHDVGHFGVTNSFLIATRAELATTYNDESVLEHMHTSKCFGTMKRSGCDFMDGISSKDYNTFRKKVVEAIMATDMAHHFELVDRFTERIKKLAENPLETDTKNLSVEGTQERRAASKADRRMLIQAFLHMADFGKNCSRWEYHVINVVALEEEFFQQGDRERELGLPISPMSDRSKDSLAVCQGAFLPKVVFPLFEPLMRVVNEEANRTLVANLENNQSRWSELIEEHGKMKACELYQIMDEES